MNQTTSCVVPTELTDDLRSYELVDVRTPGEFESSRLPHSVNRPLDQLEQHVGELREQHDEGRQVVLVCQSGNRATQAQAILAEAGIRSDVLTGGVEGWRNEGRDVVVDVMRWDMDRQVRFVAGGLVVVAVAASIVVPGAQFVAGAIGAGLVVSAVTNACTLALLLAKLPYNRSRGA